MPEHLYLHYFEMRYTQKSLHAIWHKLRDNKKIVQNTGYLSIIEMLRLILPFVALPYVIRTIGTEKYGMIAFVQTINQFLIIIINFGFDVSAVREIALNRDNKDAINKIVSSVLSIKAILLFLCFFIVIIGMWCFPFMCDNKSLTIFAFLTCFSEVLFPVWFFQGIEKMKYITIVKAVSIFFYFSTVFLFIRSQKDYEYVALLQSCGEILSGAIAFYCLISIEDVHLKTPSFSIILKTFKEAVPFWFSRISVVFNTNMAKTVSGLFLSMESVAAFDIAQKVTNGILIPTRMLNQATYPHIAKEKNHYFAFKFLCFVALVAFVLSAIVFLLAPLIIYYFSGHEMPEAVSILRVLCIYALTTSIVICLGSCTLVAFGYPRPFNMSVIWSSLFLATIYLCYYLIGVRASYMFALAFVFCDMFVLCYRSYYCYKYKLFKL